MAANRSLMVANRSLMAANRSLMAANRSLTAANRSLMAGNRSLMAANRSLMGQKPQPIYHNKLPLTLRLRIGNLLANTIFLDSDQLEELDLIFETVRSNTKNLVVLLTKMILTRPWCIGWLVCLFVGWLVDCVGKEGRKEGQK